MMYWQEDRLPRKSRQQRLKAIERPRASEKNRKGSVSENCGRWNANLGKQAQRVLHEVNHG